MFILIDIYTGDSRHNFRESLLFKRMTSTENFDLGVIVELGAEGRIRNEERGHPSGVVGSALLFVVLDYERYMPTFGPYHSTYLGINSSLARFLWISCY